MMETTDTRPLRAELEQLRDKLSVAMPLIKAQGAEIAELRQRLEQAEQRAAAAEEALEPLRGAGDRRMLPGGIVFAEEFFDRVLANARGAKGWRNGR